MQKQCFFYTYKPTCCTQKHPTRTHAHQPTPNNTTCTMETQNKTKYSYAFVASKDSISRGIHTLTEFCFLLLNHKLEKGRDTVCKLQHLRRKSRGRRQNEKGRWNTTLLSLSLSLSLSLPHAHTHIPAGVQAHSSVQDQHTRAISLQICANSTGSLRCQCLPETRDELIPTI